MEQVLANDANNTAWLFHLTNGTLPVWNVLSFLAPNSYFQGNKWNACELGTHSRWLVWFGALVTYQSITGADGSASLDCGLVPHFTQEVAPGGPGQRPDLGSSQATVPSLRHEARRQQVRVEGEVEAQAAVAVPQLVEDSAQVGRPLRGFPALHATSVVRQEVGQEVTSGIHSCGVNHFVRRQNWEKEDGF